MGTSSSKTYLALGNQSFRDGLFSKALEYYAQALKKEPRLEHIINFNIQLLERRGFSLAPRRPLPISGLASHTQPARKLPITALVITWDVGHNPLGRSYMLGEVLQRVVRHALMVGFQFPRYGQEIWEPVRNGKLPIISLPGQNLPEFHQSLERIAERIRPDIVIACKPRLPSVELGMMIREKWGCPLVVDIDDHELSFFTDRRELDLGEIAEMPTGAAGQNIEPYGQLWTRLTQSLCRTADAIIVSNVALQSEFGGTIVPHVRDENTFDPQKADGLEARRRHGVPENAKVVLFFGTPRLHKGVDLLAQAVNRIQDPSFRLVVVGRSPDRNVTAKLDAFAPGKIIYLPNQPFDAVPEIISMADVICLPQDQGHAISAFQLPAKAIDAVAMGVPLLVSRTPPLKMLVDDGVAEFVDTDQIQIELLRIAGNKTYAERWRTHTRKKFIQKYSYEAAAQTMRTLIQRCISCRPREAMTSYRKIVNESLRVIGVTQPLKAADTQQAGVDIVLFWKQNDTALYGRRHDMIIKYLSARSDVRKVIVFDSPISEFDLLKRRDSYGEVTQDRFIYVKTYEKALGKLDCHKVSYNVFIYPPSTYSTTADSGDRPQLIDAYIDFMNKVFEREGVRPNQSIFWIYPKNFMAPALVDWYKPAKVVVDVVDDHRAWPGISIEERHRLTDNYKNTLAKANMAFVNCQALAKAMSEFSPNIRLVPNGCDTDPPKVEPVQHVEYEKFKSWEGKTIGFVGNLEKKIDIPLLEKIAEKFSDCQLVLIGSTHANPDILRLKRYSNVRFAGVVPYDEVGAWLSRFDVGIIPHLHFEMTKHMNPLKFYVYLTWKVPVVSTEIFNIDRNARFVNVAESHEEFLEQIAAVLAKRPSKTSELHKYIDENSWNNRFHAHVDELLAQFEKPIYGK